jgi:hypothetical protein
MAVLSFFGDQPSNAGLVAKNNSGIALYIGGSRPQPEYDLPGLKADLITSKMKKLIENEKEHIKSLQHLRKINEEYFGLDSVRAIVDETI